MPPLLANPELRHQLDSPLAWIFWRDAPNGSGRQGFVAIAFACLRPDCTCTELALHGSLVDERLRFVGRIDDELEYAFAGDHAATELAGATAFASARCTVHLDYTARTVRGGGGDEAVLQQVVPWLQSALDDQLAAEIEHAVQVLKRQPRGIPHDPWRDWRPGDLASHSEHFPAAVLPILDWRDQEWVVEDLHCIDPRCSCDDVRFTFSRIDRGTGTGTATATATFAGTLVTKLPRLEVSDLETEPQLLATTAELRELWRALVARHGDLAALLTQRRREMKQLQPPRPIATVPARRTKVGRNDPCPCGSGKKAKKCCAG